MTNTELGQQLYWRRRRCVRCRATPAVATLNIEGRIHHKAELRCIDTKACGRRKKRLKENDRHGAGGLCGPVPGQAPA